MAGNARQKRQTKKRKDRQRMEARLILLRQRVCGYEGYGVDRAARMSQAAMERVIRVGKRRHRIAHIDHRHPAAHGANLYAALLGLPPPFGPAKGGGDG